MVWNHIYQSVDVNIGIGTFKRHSNIPLYVFRIYWSTRHDLITGAPYALFMHPYTCTLNWICVSVTGAYKHYCVSAPFVTVSVLCCICIVYCKAYCGNKLFFCSVLFCSVQIIMSLGYNCLNNVTYKMLPIHPCGFIQVKSDTFCTMDPWNFMWNEDFDRKFLIKLEIVSNCMCNFIWNKAEMSLFHTKFDMPFYIEIYRKIHMRN